jgi:hypothetical protein
MSKETFESDFSTYKRELDGYESEFRNLLRSSFDRGTQTYIVNDGLFQQIESIRSKIEGAGNSMLYKYSAVINSEQFHMGGRSTRKKRIQDAVESLSSDYNAAKEAHDKFLRQKTYIDFEQKKQELAGLNRSAREESERNRRIDEEKIKLAEEERRRREQEAEQQRQELERQRNVMQQQLAEAQQRVKELEKENQTRQEKTTVEKNLKDELSNGQYQSQEIDETHIKINYQPFLATTDPRKAYRALVNQLRKTMIATEVIGDIKNENGSLVIELKAPNDKARLDAFLIDIASKNNHGSAQGLGRKS